MLYFDFGFVFFFFFFFFFLRLCSNIVYIYIFSLIIFLILKKVVAFVNLKPFFRHKCNNGDGNNQDKYC